ncbi:hypothetical protein TSACC_23058 [Terrimicrobium sacchariphilum]|uniref:Uncharacterized protein n=1 Tax=Terrimicrobium sacchariphilum TaxID=690879 RepID=A0A146GDP5_TERSA|nr:hypothetical protein [Terrimicrobium sacchariphilum]GAT34626.1 hypothetical protein TSACC_23058 [Terrimicrobium sacchariphilum]
MKAFPLLVFLLTLASPIHAQLAALETLVRQSDDIAIVTVEEPAEGFWGSAPISNQDQVFYWQDSIVRVVVQETLKGDLKPGAKPLISLRIPNQPASEEMTAPYAKGKKALVFLRDRSKSETHSGASLNDEPVQYLTFDPLFSWMSYSRPLELATRRLLFGSNVSLPD